MWIYPAIDSASGEAKDKIGEDKEIASNTSTCVEIEHLHFPL